MGKCVMLVPELSIKSNSHKASFTPSSTRTQIHQHASSFALMVSPSEITPYTIFNHTGQNFEGGFKVSTIHKPLPGLLCPLAIGGLFFVGLPSVIICKSLVEC